MTQSSSRAQLRADLRNARRALSAAEQNQASRQLLAQLQTLPAFINAKRIAAYLANDGEPDVTPVITHCWQHQQQVSLPVLHPFSRQHLLFQDYHTGTVMTMNRFKIAEPALDCAAIASLAEHQVILMPLVGFDAQGNRLGMGGGFYDRSLARLSELLAPPVLLGIAHDCQQVGDLPVASWDIPCDAIVTPSRIWNTK